MRDSAHGLGVLVVAEVEAAAGELAVPATVDERLGELEVAGLPGLAVELDERRLDLGMAVGAGLRAAAEDVVDEVGEATGDPEQAVSPVARANAIPAWIRCPAQ